jgi:transposase
MLQANVSKLQLSKTEKIQDIESKPQVRRRVWPATAKLQVLKDIDALKGHQVEIGAYLRRQGLYSSTVSLWRKWRREGILTSVSTQRGPVPKQTQEQKENERLMQENAKLRKELEVSKKLVEIQKKVFALLDEEK